MLPCYCCVLSTTWLFVLADAFPLCLLMHHVLVLLSVLIEKKAGDNSAPAAKDSPSSASAPGAKEGQYIHSRLC